MSNIKDQVMVRERIQEDFKQWCKSLNVNPGFHQITGYYIGKGLLKQADLENYYKLLTSPGPSPEGSK